ncbi:MAG: ABC transporter permease [Oscillospiraceae bacterium]|nr:ABC transporter permease [Oscillospiraceae bacterium]
MKVKNGSCIRHLSFKTLMSARKRNIIAVLAIALTALLFTSLFTIVMSINETNQNYQFRSVGGYAHGAFKDVDEDQIAVLSAHPDVKAVGVRTVLGLATQGAFEKDYAEVSYMDDNNAKWSFSQPTVGRTPKSGNEITMDTKALELLGVKPELGAQVKVTYTLADKEQMGWDITDTFTLVGWWDYDELLSVHFLNVSKEYAQKIERKAVAGGMKPFRTDLSVMLRSSLNIENDLTRIGEDCGYSIGEEAGQLRIGVNWGYTATQVWDTLGVGGILAMLAVLILVAFTGYLVIYNIFQISVAGDIRYYGLLKTIGVTPKQLRRLIRQQALLLSVLGIPVGLLLGYGVGAAAVPITMSTSTMGGRYTTVSVSPWIFLFSTVFALLTVLLSCARPGRIAGRVSPVEAVRYTERQSAGKTHRKGSKVTPVQMAAANLGRDKKKTALVMVSLSLTVVLLNLLVTFIGGFDMDKYLSRRSCADFLISTPDYFNYRGFSLTKEAVEPVRANTAHSLEGFAYQTGGVGMYLPESVWRDEAAFYSRDTDMDIDTLLAQTPRDGDKVQAVSQIEGLDPTLGEKLTVIDGSLDSLWEPDSHAIAIAVNLDDSGKLPNPGIYPAVGEKIKVTYGNGDTAHDVTYTVCALVDVPYNMSSRFYTMGYEAILSADALYRDAGEDNVFPMVYLFDTPSPEAEAAAESYLAQLTSDPDSPLMYESKATHRAYFREFRMTFVILGGLLCAIIGIVGILNFFNAMMTAILARSREFAVLQSVGMTGRQLETMLLWEGLLYTLGSGLIAGLLSAAINPLAGRLLESAYWFYSYHYTITPVLAMLPAFIVLGCAIPAVMYRQAVKQSIVERLRSLDT